MTKGMMENIHHERHLLARRLKSHIAMHGLSSGDKRRKMILEQMRYVCMTIIKSRYLFHAGTRMAYEMTCTCYFKDKQESKCQSSHVCAEVGLVVVEACPDLATNADEDLEDRKDSDSPMQCIKVDVHRDG